MSLFHLVGPKNNYIYYILTKSHRRSREASQVKFHVVSLGMLETDMIYA